MISSAVIVPEPEDVSPPSPSHKRRQSSTSYNEPFKRPRLDTQPSRDSHPRLTSPSSPPRRKPSVTGTGAAEERKRSQRLFGALLGTLSQSSTTTAQRRRADIEKKQLGKLQQRDEELEDEKRRKREKLDAVRRVEQRIWDERSVSLSLEMERRVRADAGVQMRIRHRNILAEARFLRTKAEPRLVSDRTLLFTGELELMIPIVLQAMGPPPRRTKPDQTPDRKRRENH
jgi:pinin/SDK/memA/ protein conserved region